MTTNRKVIELAYCQVNGVSKSEVKKEEHQKVLITALADVWSYEGLYENENEVLKEERLYMDGPAKGEVTELAQHFRELYPEEFTSNVTAWAIIFIMYNKLKGSSPKVTNDKSEESSDKLLKEEKERKTIMSKKDEVSEGVEVQNVEEVVLTSENAAEHNLARLHAIEEDMSSLDPITDINLTKNELIENKPSEIKSTSTINVSKDTILGQQAERLAYSKNAKWLEVVLSKPAAVDIAVEGEKAKGIIADPDKVYKTFVDKSGLEIDEAGNPRFTNIAVDSLDAAKAMYEILKKAKEDPTVELEVFFSKSSGTIKGFKYCDDKGGAGMYVKVQDMIDLILNKTAGALSAPDSSVQLQVHKARKSSSNAVSKSSGVQKGNKKTSFSGIASIRISNKSKALETMSTYHKEIVKDNVDLRTGMKSDMSIRYFRGMKDDQGKEKVGTWRIPLKVKQYALAIVDKEKEVLGGLGNGVGATVNPINLDNEKDVAETLQKLAQIAADASIEGLGGENSILNQIRREANEKVAEAEQRLEKNEALAACLL